MTTLTSHCGARKKKKESSFHLFRFGGKVSSPVVLPTRTVFMHKKKNDPSKENFVQKTKRKLFGKAKKSGGKVKTEEGKTPERTEMMEAPKEEGGKGAIRETLIHFPEINREKKVVSENANTTKATRAENGYCSSIPMSTNPSGSQTFITRRRSMLRVMYDFEALAENDVSVKRGEMVTVLNKDDKDWWWVENSRLQKGFVPKDYIWPCACYGKMKSSASCYFPLLLNSTVGFVLLSLLSQFQVLYLFLVRFYLLNKFASSYS